MENFGSEIGQKMRSAVKAKLLELGTGGSAGYIDDELPDYVMIMVANKRSKQQMIADLNLFLGSQTELFVTWLHDVLEKLQEVTLPAGSASAQKRKLSQKEETAITAPSYKKEKKSGRRDKKVVSTKTPAPVVAAVEELQTPSTTTGSNAVGPILNSITDVFAEDLLEKAKKSLDHGVNACAAVKKGKAKTINKALTARQETQKEAGGFDIPTISEITSTTGTVSSGDREKDLAELAEIQKKIFAVKKHLKNLEKYNEVESEDGDFLNLKEDGKAEDFNEANDLGVKRSAKPKSPIIFDRKDIEKERQVEEEKEQHLPIKRRRISPPQLDSTISVSNCNADISRAKSPPLHKNQRDNVIPRRSRERERPESSTQGNKRPVHARLGVKSQTQREEKVRERRGRQQKELYVPLYRRKGIENEREQQREKEHMRDQERIRDRSFAKRRSPDKQPTSPPHSNSNGRRRSVPSTPTQRTALDVRKKNDAGDDIEEVPQMKRQRIGSRVIVASTKPPEPSDDEDIIEKPINSIIKIKPRPSVSPSKQAPKNLLLKAVAEAQRSTILTKSKISEGLPKVTVHLGKGNSSERNTNLYTKSYRERMKRKTLSATTAQYRNSAKNFVIEVESGTNKTTSNSRGNRHTLGNHDEKNVEGYMTPSESEREESDVDYIYVPQMITNINDFEEHDEISYHINEDDYENDVIVNDIDMEKTQFVVTMNDDKSKYERSHSLARSRSPSAQPQVSSSSSVSRNKDKDKEKEKDKDSNLDKGNTKIGRRKLSRPRISDPVPTEKRARSQVKVSLGATSTDAVNAPSSSNTPPVRQHRADFIEAYPKKDIKKIIIKNDSEDEGKISKKLIQRDKVECNSKQKRRGGKEVTDERSTTPPLPPNSHIRATSNAEKAMPPSPRTTKYKRTPIKFDLESCDRNEKDIVSLNRDEEKRSGSTVTSKRRSKSSEHETSPDRRSSDGYHSSRQKISIRNLEVKKYDNIPSLSSVAIDSAAIKLHKPKERCKYHPNCTKHNCDFYHPSAPCKSFPNCKYADKCMYSHPRCKFDMSCSNIDCNFSHSGPRNYSLLQPTAPPLSSHVVPVQNYKSISVAPAASSAMCKYYPNCTKIGCTFFHPKPCRFGKNCINKLECNFYHHELQSSSKFKWVASVM